MTLDRNPPAARGDRHALVIVAVAAPAGEGVAEPEIVVGGDCVGDVGEARGALVGGNDEIRVVAAMDHDLDGMDDITLDDIVGDREQRADEDSYAFGSFGNPGLKI